jgi:hypothetical protein
MNRCEIKKYGRFESFSFLRRWDQNSRIHYSRWVEGLLQASHKGSLNGAPIPLGNRELGAAKAVLASKAAAHFCR